MDNLDKYIDGLFHDKLSGAEKSGVFSDVEWMRLSKTIRTNNFLRFSAGSFNVYYLSVVVSAVVTIGAIVNNNLSKDTVPGKHESNPVIYSDTLDIIHQESLEKDSSFHIEASIEKNTNVNFLNTQKEDIKVNNNTISQVDSIRIETMPNVLKPVIRTDTGRVVPTSNEGGRFLISPPKADSLIVVDTVKVIKKQIKFQRKTTN